MSRSQEQSIKEHIRTLSKERNLTFAELWQNLVLERFLARLHESNHKEHFILKGGSLLARYIDLGRETRDLDFLVEKMANAIVSVSDAIDRICCIDLDDAFSFERIKIHPLTHPHMNYTGAQVALLARLGKTKTHLLIDIGFGDIVEPVDHSITLTSTRKGPLFENKIQLKCYPKEFIFAEKLETVIYRGGVNSRMKDFHDLYSLVSLSECLNSTYLEKVIINVFNHRGTSIQKLPLNFDTIAITNLQSLWENYCKELKPSISLPSSLGKVVSTINHWLESATALCKCEKI
ncbi:MAG: nucleotidyl transferase AbiEii/AbiGii toxin family protein [Chlamydiae bacterium CG10_big_fil_rev_8_21_14_0_10_35_9]|nr:MAG: nucleotidyl transferase AbiEii/AbiGii toxin family protein [Chlamydiae bacterium CG10_big_fil_rev_8_21_14_0_10_35_9]